ncbi:MAG TPA: ABC-F family ATP-binding cassette domain-containing protein [Crocinitomicaceae bacterium]|nr:ABC-F family ATP-binding cassette domain-containing protein [Crocinitomicaceae bacterium]
MNYLSVENISKSFGDRIIFKDLTFGIDLGQKAAIVAKNGSGKSTLLRCLMQLDTVDDGRVVFRNEIKVSFMEQTEDFDPEKTVADIIFEQATKEFEILREYNAAQLVNDEERINEALTLMTENHVWDLEVKVNQILSILKLDDKYQKVSSLSGGQKKRINLAKVLISEADFYILDEPTNHLDLDMIEWLEEYLSKSKATILMVTHDRYFLEVICDTIYELEDQTIYKYKGNFSYYLEKKAERQEQLQATIDKARNTFRKELDWVRRQPKARGTKQKARLENFQDVKKTASQRIQEDELEIPIKMERLGTKIVELHKVGKHYGDKKIMADFSYNFQRQERLGIVGNNGVGKSTFLNIVQGLEPVDMGKVVIGDTAVFGYYSQDLIKVDENKKVIEVIRDIAEFIPLEKGKELSAAQLLERFLFPRNMHYNYVYKLSGGEKRRLKLLTVLMANPNFLILDEPTNDLDIFVMSVLEDYLRAFQGCLIIVSHDRYFMDKMVDHLFVFEGAGKIKDIVGNYSEYREKQKIEKQEMRENKVETVKPVEVVTTDKKKLSYKERIEFDKIEKELEELELRKENVSQKLSSGELSNDELMKTGEELSAIVQEIEDKTNRWLELSEFD